MEDHEGQPSPNEVVVLDDEEHWLKFFSNLNVKNASRFKFVTFTMHRDALLYAKQSSSRGALYAAFVDIELKSDRNGLDFIQAAREAGVSIPFIVSSQYTPQDLFADGPGIKFSQPISYFVDKDKMRFDEDQNVDLITEKANDIYQDRLRAAVGDYAKRNMTLVSEWRRDLSEVTATLDEIIIFSGPKNAAKSSALEPVLTVAVSKITSCRSALVSLMGRMHWDHVQAAVTSFGQAGRPSDDEKPPEPLPQPAFNRLKLLTEGVLEVLRQAETPAPGDGVGSRDARLRFVEALGTRLGEASRLETAMALSLAVERLFSLSCENEALHLATGTADLFALRNDDDHEVAFSAIAARISEQLGRTTEHELWIRRAARVTARSGRLSLMLEMSPTNG